MMQPVELKFCENCGDPLVRKTYERRRYGYVYREQENLSKFQNRKYCCDPCKNAHLLKSLWADPSYRDMMTTDLIITPEQREIRRVNALRQWADGTRRAHVLAIKRRIMPDWNGLSEDEVRKIITDPRPYQQIGDEYRISRTSVSKIKLGALYKIDNPPEAVTSRRGKKTIARQKITDDEIATILADQGNYRDIAQKYGISRSYVGHIKRSSIKQPTRTSRLPAIEIQAIVAAPETYRIIAEKYKISISYVAKLKKRALTVVHKPE